MRFPAHSAILSGPTSRSRNPPVQAPRFGLFPFRSPLLRESLPLSFPQGTEMFHFPWCRSEALCIQTPVSRHDSGWVSPFGNPRIKACLPLPEAYRSLPRPSSPTDAKASTVRPSLLDQKMVNVAAQSSVKIVLPVSMQMSKNQKYCRLQIDDFRLGPSSAFYHQSPIFNRQSAMLSGRAWIRTRDLVLIRDAL